MKIARECISCLARQAVEVAAEASQDHRVQEDIIRESLRMLAEADYQATSPEIAFKIHEYAKKVTGHLDPYQALKNDYNLYANRLAKRVRAEKWIEQSHDPFDMACRLAIAGNIIDFSLGLELTEEDLLVSIEDSLKKDIFGSKSSSLREQAMKAKKIMYIGDNAGEIVFDKFLLEQLPNQRVTYAVKGGPIVNDATRADAYEAGLDQMVEIIDSGLAAQGTILPMTSQTFQEAFEASDLIISKGQANFETLSDLKNKKIFFLLRAKCKSIAHEISCSQGDYVLLENMTYS